MLRALFFALVFANLGFYAWTQGWLDGIAGTRAAGDREPERLARQVRPETVVILPPGAASAPGTPAPTACLEAGPFSTTELISASATLKEALPGLPEGSWLEAKAETPGAWIVYMGKFNDSESLTKKEQELKRLKVEFEEVRNQPALARGLSLGRHEQRGAADKALERLVQQGVRSARVVEVAAPASVTLLRVPRADSELAARLTALRSAGLGKGFVACAKAP